MAVRTHSVKIAPKCLDAVVAGQKKAELRKNDRAYSVGDILLLQEWKHGAYKGREWAAVLTHILPVNEVMPDSCGWVMLSIRSLSPLDAIAYVITRGVQ